MADTTPLLDNYLALFPNKARALDHLNESTGRVYKHNAIYSWGDPTRPNPQQDVYELMVKEILEDRGLEDIYDLIRHNY